MLNAAIILQYIDQLFTQLIFLPAVFLLYCSFTKYHKKTPKRRLCYRICLILILIFLLRCFCVQFIFTEVNYQHFADNGLFPLIDAVFYQGQ